MSSFGVDPENNVFIYQPKEGAEQLTVEDVADYVKKVAITFKEVGKPLLIIWDSLASTATKAELADNYNNDRIGTKAKAVTGLTTRIGQVIQQSNVAFIIINQARDDMSNPMFPTIKAPGGRALEHWASLILEVQKASTIKDKVEKPNGDIKEEYIGHEFRVKVKKSKMSTPNSQAVSYLISRPYIGLDFVENVYRSAVDHYKQISKGAWRSYTTDAGEVIKLRDKEWVPLLRSDEGAEVLEELFIKQMLTYFPEGFAALNSKNIDITVEPFYATLKKVYAERAKQAKIDKANQKETDAEEEAVKEEGEKA